MQLSDINDVHIDEEGIFKYIQIQIKNIQTNESKVIIRGFEECEYHADIYDRVLPFLQGAGYKCKCVGGGRIKRSKNEIFVYGYSVGFGKADHAISCEVIRNWVDEKQLKEIKKVHWSDEGY